MEVLQEIAIACKDRILLLDRDLQNRNIDVSKGSEWSHKFYSWKGRHYNNLKQGPGWSFPRDSFLSPIDIIQKQEPTEPIVRPKSDNKNTVVAYDMDIPDEVRRYFRNYEAIIFQEEHSTR
jgi:hypothetical protein